MRATIALAVAAALAVVAPARAAPPPIRHVFVIVLENKGFNETFGPASKAPYLARELTAQGELLTGYYGVTHQSLGNYIAMVSGQGSNPDTQSDCMLYADLAPGTVGADGQATGRGCVYPTAVKTIADQLQERGLTWRGYMEDMGNNPTQPAACRHPAVGSPDDTQNAKSGDAYAARHNPFVYFHSLIDDQASCEAHDVPLDRLPSDLADEAAAPNFSFIVPNLCNDAHDAPCKDGRVGGLTSADGWLRAWVPQILASAAFQRDGLLLVTFDEAEAPPSKADDDYDASACCNQPAFPNTPNPGGPMLGPGGGHIGAVLLSRWVAPGTLVPTPYNHFALLRSLEDIFGLSHLGFAARDDLRAFSDDVYTGHPAPGAGPTAAPCAPGAPPAARRRRFPRGSFIASARVRRAGRRVRLYVRMTRGARLTIRARRAHRRARRVGPRSGRACAAYAVRLPGHHGVVTVAASRKAGSERRRVRY